MSVSIKSLNGDTTFLLTFRPPASASNSPDLTHRPFTILIDPWLVGAAHVLTPRFALIKHKEKPCLSSLTELPSPPDLILISQDKPDHCHRETLCQLPSDCRSTILATTAAAKKIQKWKHFDPSRVLPMHRYVHRTDPSSVYRQTLPAASPSGTPGEVTVSFICSKWDVKGLHNAIGITYRAPVEASAKSTLAVDLPFNPPDSPMSPRSISTMSKKTLASSIFNNEKEKAVSVVYTPHGVSYSMIRPYATQHLVAENALPLSALIHSLDRVENPWYMGGNIATGFPGGQNLVQNLACTAWIAAHDAEKDKTGVSVQLLRTSKYAPDMAQGVLREAVRADDKGIITEIVSLGIGQEYQVNTT